MGFWLLLCLALNARAVPPPPAPPPSTSEGPQTNAQLVYQLRHGSHGEQQYAARELHRAVRSAVRDERYAPADSMRALEARETLVELQGPLGVACIASLNEPSLARSCANILVLLETSNAVEPLKAALSAGPGWRSRRALQRALDQLEPSS